MKLDKRIIILIIAGLAVATVGIMYLQGYNSGKNVFQEPPKEIANYILVEYRSGEEAMASLAKIHFFLTTQESIVDGLVAIYAKNHDVAHIWAVAYETPEEAQMMTQQMYSKMTQADTPYTPPEETVVNGIVVYTGTGNNMYYIFYNKDNKVIWISITGSQEDIMSFTGQAINSL